MKTGESLGPGQNGEICIKSPMNMLKYVNNPQATQETIDAGGWLHTGFINCFYFVIIMVKIIIVIERRR
jgi:long-subunit acyl-CoA synthetase (AMP-forming)